MSAMPTTESSSAAQVPSGGLRKQATSYSASPLAMLRSLVVNRSLIATLTRRTVASRYRGSTLGVVWSVLTPVLMLAVYTFVFSEVFKQKVDGGPGTWADFALVLFAALLIFNMFSAAVTSAPALIINNANFVKKVVFPLEVLPVVALVAALIDMLLSVGVWLALYLIAIGVPQLTLLWLPLVLLPAVLVALGATWLLAALGVYVRDVGPLVGILVMVMMFMTPIFYQIGNINPALRPYLYASPLTVPVEAARDVMFWGRMPDFPALATSTAACALVAWLGFVFFQKTRRGFADVI